MEFTKELKEAALYLRRFQDWRRGDDVRTMPGANIDDRELGKAIDLILAYFGYPETLAMCRQCKHNGERSGYVGCIRESAFDNRECVFEEAED
jgi:hypothetical protein